MRNSILWSAAVLLLLPAAARATDIPVTNFSFEDSNNGANTGDCCVAGSLPGWTFNVPSGVDGTQNQATPGKTGTFWAFMNLGSAADTGYLTTSISPTIIAPDTKYTLTIALGNNGEQGTGYGEPGDTTIRLLSGSTPIPGASDFVPEGTISNNSFLDFTATYTSGANSTVDPFVGTALNIQMQSTGVAGSDGHAVGSDQPIYDNVRLTGVSVPEPGSLVLLGLGAVGLVAAARRRRSA